MAYSITFTDPPNPTSVHAGNDADMTFFDSLAGTLNAAHAQTNIQGISQGFRDDLFVHTGAGSNGQMTRHRMPVPSRAHTSLKVVFRARHVQSGSSYGRFLVNIYTSAGSLIASSYSTLSNSSTNQMGTVTLTGINSTDDHIQVRCGMLSSAAGSFSYCEDITASWVPLTSVATTKSEQGEIIPVGTTTVDEGRPISAALGYCLMQTSNALLKRLRLLCSISGVSGASLSDVAYIPPFPLCQIVRMNHSTEKTRVYWWVLAVNSGSTAQDFKVGHGEIGPLFNHAVNEPNEFTLFGTDSQTVPASTTAWYNGYIDIRGSIRQTRGMHERFIFLTCSTAAMSRRDAFGFDSFSNDLLIRSANFWSE